MSFWVVNFFLWIFFVWSKFTNPGFIPSDREAYDKAVKMVSIVATAHEVGQCHIDSNYSTYRNLVISLVNLCIFM